MEQSVFVMLVSPLYRHIGTNVTRKSLLLNMFIVELLTNMHTNKQLPKEHGVK